VKRDTGGARGQRAAIPGLAFIYTHFPLSACLTLLNAMRPGIRRTSSRLLATILLAGMMDQLPVCASFTTQVAAPGVFNKSSPANGSTGQSTSPTLSWGASAGATNYEYCLDTTNNNVCDTSPTLMRFGASHIGTMSMRSFADAFSGTQP
jgi:hypothetical protein